jgi:hypothetical protein
MAIKVNGTTVINDSRALQNVASVDATTVAAMGAAGVGGGLKLLQNTTTTSNATYIDVDFPSGYDWIRIHIGGIRVTNTDYSGELVARLLNSSGLITSSTYLYHRWDQSGGGYTMINSMDINVRAFLSNSTHGNNLVVDVRNPRDSGCSTMASMQTIGRGVYQTGYGADNFFRQATYSLEAHETNTGIRFYSNDGKTLNSGFKIKVWGAVNA